MARIIYCSGACLHVHMCLNLVSFISDFPNFPFILRLGHLFPVSPYTGEHHNIFFLLDWAQARCPAYKTHHQCSALLRRLCSPTSEYMSECLVQKGLWRGGLLYIGCYWQAINSGFLSPVNVATLSFTHQQATSKIYLYSIMCRYAGMQVPFKNLLLFL